MSDEYDVTIIGGSFAGLTAATYLARGRRRVLVVDAGEPRNRFADASHGFLSRDGDTPRAILETARGQIQRYPTLTLIRGRVTEAAARSGGFISTLEDGSQVRSRRVVIATGVADVLPDVPGLAERWGRSVLHCPYCHGYEHAGERLGVLAAGARSVHQACLLADWGPVTIFLNGMALDREGAAALARRGVRVVDDPVVALDGAAPALEAVRLAGGRAVAVDALFVSAPTRLASPIADQLGCALDEGPFGPVIRTGADKLTSVPGVYAAGDAARAPHSVAWAVADGMTAGVAAHQSLVFEPTA